MFLYLVRMNRWVFLFLVVMVGYAVAQEPIPPPSIPTHPKGFIDWAIKASPFLLGMTQLYLPDLLMGWMPKLLNKVPPPLIKVVCAVLTMAVSAANAAGTGALLDHQGGVTPEVAVVETAATNAALYRGTDITPSDEKKPKE